MRTPEWISRCEPVHDAELDIGVTVWDSYYFGPGNNFTHDEWRNLRTPLYRPKVVERIVRRSSLPSDVWMPEWRYASLAAATADELTELRRYFADILRAMSEHGRPMRSAEHHFGLRLGIFAAVEYAINWWQRDWRSIERVLVALTAPVDDRRVIYDDVEQGWQVIVFATPTALFIRQSDFDTGQEVRLITCQRQTIVSQVERLKARTPALLRQFEESLGHPELF